MAAHGINAVRVYSVPPRWLLDAASRHGLRVMVGLAWEQHVAFLDDRTRGPIHRGAGPRRGTNLRWSPGDPLLRDWQRDPGLDRALAWRAPGGAIPGAALSRRESRGSGSPRHVRQLPLDRVPSARLRRLRLLQRLPRVTRTSSFAYLARLQNLAGDRPLLLAEVGLDSRRNGEAEQASDLDWQITHALRRRLRRRLRLRLDRRMAPRRVRHRRLGLRADSTRPPAEAGASGRARRLRRGAVSGRDLPWPRVSVVVCSHNGARTIRDTLEGLRRLDYPELRGHRRRRRFDRRDRGDRGRVRRPADPHREPRAEQRAQHRAGRRPPARSSPTPTTTLVPIPHWLTYLAATFMTTDHVGIGGPNIAPPGDGPIADCVANAPGGPSRPADRRARPSTSPAATWRSGGMRSRRSAASTRSFRAAGDDVDVCWRLQERGWTLGFSPAAMVWHHRRNSVATYWRQQQGYGKAEALLEEKWPERYNAARASQLGGPPLRQRADTRRS